MVCMVAVHFILMSPVLLKVFSFTLILSPRTLERLRSLLKPLAERWAGVHLTHAATYGVR